MTNQRKPFILYAVLKEDDAVEVRTDAALALWRIQHGEDPTAARLIEALKDKDKNTRWAAGKKRL